jgi:small subunit ribosomal protein S7
MPRKNNPKKRFPNPDNIYNSYLISLFILRILKNGKKSLARKIMDETLEIVNERTKLEPLTCLEQAIKNISPTIELKSRRVGGATYQVPIPITRYRATGIAIRWIIKYAKGRSGKNISVKLANEIIDASKGFGSAMRRKNELYSMAEANKAFSGKFV